jgi:pyruvate dehydrogenase E2 component (dihydrolipoamide acetyltransferase)
MASLKDVLVPDIGDFKDIPVIEVLVKPGDTVSPEESLITLESDKATMEVPAPFGGTVKEMKVKVGDKISEGAVILSIESSDDAAPDAGTSSADAPQAATARAEVTPTPSPKPDEPPKAVAPPSPIVFFTKL